MAAPGGEPAPAAPEGGGAAAAALAERIAELEAKAPQGGAVGAAAGAAMYKSAMREWKAAAATEGTAEERVSALKAVFVKHMTLAKKSAAQVTVHSQREAGLERELSLARKALQKTTAVKDKLEELCRELQIRNRTVLEDAKRMSEEDAAKRKELSDHFSQTIAGVQEKLAVQGAEREETIKENEDIRGKLKKFLEEYELREEHHAKELETKDLQRQLAEAKFAQSEEIARMSVEKARLLEASLADSKATEEALKEQLASYASKFEEFQSTIGKSNRAFEGFQTEMDKMAKMVKKSQSESLQLRKANEETAAMLLRMSDEKAAVVKDYHKCQVQRESLKGLCTALQKERSEARAEIADLRARLGITATDEAETAAAEGATAGAAAPDAAGAGGDAAE